MLHCFSPKLVTTAFKIQAVQLYMMCKRANNYLQLKLQSFNIRSRPQRTDYGSEQVDF